jgi:hypothetical protein
MGVCCLLLACGDDGQFPPKTSPTPAPSADAGPVWPDAELVTTPATPYQPKQTMFSHSGDTLFRIDPKLLKVEAVGQFWPNAPHMTDLAVTPDGQLYALSTNNLFRVNAVTAEVSWVAKVPGLTNVALTFDKDGSLLAADKSGGFRRIDPGSGQVTEIGNYGPNLGSSGDLVGLKDGRLYDVNDVGAASYDNELIRVDPQTGTASPVGKIGFRAVWGLSFWGGTLYGFTRKGEFIAIDPQTGKGSLIQSTTQEFWGAAVTPEAPLYLE